MRLVGARLRQNLFLKKFRPVWRRVHAITRLSCLCLLGTMIASFLRLPFFKEESHFLNNHSQFFETCSTFLIKF